MVNIMYGKFSVISVMYLKNLNCINCVGVGLWGVNYNVI